MKIAARRTLSTVLAMFAATGSAAANPTEDFDALCRDYDAWRGREFVSVALSQGDRTAIGRMQDDSVAAQVRRAEDRAAFRARLDAIDPAALAERTRVSHEILTFALDEADHAYLHREYLAPTDPLWGIHQTVGNLAAGLPLSRTEDYEAYIERVAALPAWIDDGVARMRIGLAEGHTPPRVVMEPVVAQVQAMLEPGGLDGLRQPLAEMPSSVPNDVRGRLTRRLETSLIPSVRSSLERYATFFAGEYVPGCRASIAAIDAPDGVAWYAGRLRSMTTTDMSPDEIHRVGLAEVDRIRSEMLTVIERTDWYAADPARADMDDDARFAAFIEYLRTDPRFYCETADELITRYRDICKRIDAKLPPFFHVLPRLPYGVDAIPEFLAPRQTTAYYQPGNPRVGLAGMFMANTYRLDQRPTYEMVPLSLHEAVPGHHLQIALAQELDALPDFRRSTWVTAYGEGWALYTERLGLEMGMYEDPYDDFGRLLFEMWRACRLVVDPGMHALGWSREQAIEFMRRNTALADVNIRAEVDRYIAWPGQATAYKIGELRVRALRLEAERRLGAGFDVRDFHHVVLSEGGVTIPVLERRVRAWLDGQPIGQAYD